MPSKSDFDAAEKSLKEASDLRNSQANVEKRAAAKAAMADYLPKRERAEVRFQAANADVESITSFLNIAKEHNESELAEKYAKELEQLIAKKAEMQANRDEIVNKIKLEQMVLENIEGPYTKAVANFKKVNDRLDTQVKVALNRRWGWGDWLRTQWIINGFADPLKIHQFTINDIPIDYNFKMVTRYDRCMSCHVGIRLYQGKSGGADHGRSER
jgi:hypothetical protein